jgi:nicotinamide mononucleotide transporter
MYTEQSQWKNAIPILEWLAVLFNLGFTILFQQGNSWSFLFGILGPLLLALLSWQRKLFADVLLQASYCGLAAYGYFQSIQAPSLHEYKELHFIGISCSLILGLILGYFFKSKTTAALPYLDSLITSFSLWATIILMSGLESAWLYFIFINLVSVVLFYKRKLMIIALLFVVYALLAIQGYFHIL